MDPHRSHLALTWGYGALAQLGERRLCKPEVTGSIPVRSIRVDRFAFLSLGKRVGFAASRLLTDSRFGRARQVGLGGA